MKSLNFIYWMMMFLSMALLWACTPQKSEEWLLENQKKIEATVNLNNFAVLNEAFFNERLHDLKQHKQHLNQVNAEKLSASSSQILKDLKRKTEKELAAIEKDSVFSWDASQYDLGKFLKKYYHEALTSEADFKEINNVLLQSDTFFLAAKRNLNAIHIEKGKAAVGENIALFHWLNDELVISVKSASLPADLKGELLKNIETTSRAVKDFIGYINSLINNADDLQYPTKVVVK